MSGTLVSSSATDVAQVIAEVNRLRADLGDRESFREQDFLDDLAERLEGSPALSSRPVVRAFIEDIRGFAADPSLTRTKTLVNGGEDNSIFGLFDASYFPSLSLEYLRYRTLPTDEHLAARYASPTMPVVIEAMSEGFSSRTVVALFPENQIDGRQEPDDLIFYFIDKFVERHLRLTRVLIDELMAPGLFARLREADEATLELVSSWWVRLHEFHHRQGDMPIPQYLPAKSSKPLAGLEELRTDVSSMLACLRDEELPRGMAEMTYEYILAERLLRYAVEGIPRPNYDAVASQLLFNFLREKQAVSIVDGRIHLSDDLPCALEDFLETIAGIERSVHEHGVDEARAGLLDLANRYTDYDESVNNYRHIPFFAEAKTRLGV